MKIRISTSEGKLWGHIKDTVETQKKLNTLPTRQNKMSTRLLFWNPATMKYYHKWGSLTIFISK